MKFVGILELQIQYEEIVSEYLTILQFLWMFRDKLDKMELFFRDTYY